MAEPPPREPDADETVVVPPDETVVDPGWTVPPERRVVAAETAVAEPPRRRAPRLWPWLLALLLLVLAGVIAAVALTRDDEEQAATTGAATTTAVRVVPNVVGSSEGAARATLGEAGFDANVVRVPSDRPEGTVVAQEPAAAEEAREGTEVRLNVAERPAETAPATTAETAPSTTAPVAPPSTTEPPPATTEAPPEPAVVPEVVGAELADAARSFADEGLRVSVRYVPSAEAQGRVVAQAQPAGTERRRGDTVQVNVSNGAEPAPAASVPAVVGRSLADARRALDAAGYEVLALNLRDDVRREDRVTTQSPPGGASVPRGSLVVLYVTRP